MKRMRPVTAWGVSHKIRRRKGREGRDSLWNKGMAARILYRSGSGAWICFSCMHCAITLRCDIITASMRQPVPSLDVSEVVGRPIVMDKLTSFSPPRCPTRKVQEPADIFVRLALGYTVWLWHTLLQYALPLPYPDKLLNTPHPLRCTLSFKQQHPPSRIQPDLFRRPQHSPQPLPGNEKTIPVPAVRIASVISSTVYAGLAPLTRPPARITAQRATGYQIVLLEKMVTVVPGPRP